MVGGGEGALIGEVHRMALRLDGRYRLVAGALSSEPERARRSGLAIGLEAARCYDGYREMAEREAARDDGAEVAVVVTPNDSHADICRAFLERGFDVVCDKPLCTSLADARDLAARAADRVFAVTYTYSGYPMVRAARAMVRRGDIGAVRALVVEYPQGWLAGLLELSGNKQAAWRMDPARSGPGGTLADIGTHAFHTAGFVSGLRPSALSAEVATLVPGRQLDDHCQIQLRYGDGARGLLWASQAFAGFGNALRFRVAGESGSLEWCQEDPEYLIHRPNDGARRTLRRGEPEVADLAPPSRAMVAHPEGYVEAFANLYREIADAILARREGRPAPDLLYPTVQDGLEGVAFIEAALASARDDGAWVAI